MSRSQRPKQPHIKASKPKFKPYLKFPNKSNLVDSSLALWSYDKSHKKLIDAIREGKWFHAFAFGETGEGKSNVLEVLAEKVKNLHDELIVDASGKNFEGAFWAKNYPVYLVYPHLLKPKPRSPNPNVTEIKLDHKNTWHDILRKALNNGRVVVLMCNDPLESDYLKALIKLFAYLDSPKAQKYLKTLLLRETSFFAYKHGQLKASTGKLSTTAKRKFLKLARMGRHNQIRILADAQAFKDIDQTITENVALKIIKRTETQLPDNFPKFVNDKIKVLQPHQMIFKLRGKVFTGICSLSSFHKQSEEHINDIDIYPKKVEISRYNKTVENRYIDRVVEYNTNILNRVVLARRRHLQDPENSEMCQFEIADLLALETDINISPFLTLANTKLVYGEIKFRNPNSEKHSRIETSDMKKTISDLQVKRIIFDSDKDMYFWIVDRKLAKALNWTFPREGKEKAIPVLVEMYCPRGATKGAMAMAKRHHIFIRSVKIDEETFFS